MAPLLGFREADHGRALDGYGPPRSPSTADDHGPPRRDTAHQQGRGRLGPGKAAQER